MKLKIEMTLDNAAFSDGDGRSDEAQRILRHLADSMDAGHELSEPGDHCTLRDVNGNNVGTARLEGK